MGNFDDFDLDLQAVKANESENKAQLASGVFTCMTCEGISDSFAKCTQNRKFQSCFCSTCCTGATRPKGCKTLGCK